MRLLRIHVIAADTCGGLLDGLDLWLKSPFGHYGTFEPLGLIGPNGAGKSQFLQVLAEIFQAVFHAIVPEEERIEGNPSLQFEVEYLIRPHGTDSDVHVRIARLAEGRRRPALVIQTKVDSEWASCDLTDRTTLAVPQRVGYARRQRTLSRESPVVTLIWSAAAGKGLTRLSPILDCCGSTTARISSTRGGCWVRTSGAGAASGCTTARRAFVPVHRSTRALRGAKGASAPQVRFHARGYSIDAGTRRSPRLAATLRHLLCL